MKIDNKRIAKNTLLLYVRTFFVMIITLYTSRIILSALGVDDFGIYNVVGGLVAMFSIMSGTLSAAISRFITFELGNGNDDTLNKVFSVSINILMIFAGIIFLLCETVGLWFLNYKMNIPIERLTSANWVLQCSIISFLFNLITIPYNAVIIAHEKMSAFAYISVFESVTKLGISFLILYSTFDKLVIYSMLIMMTSIAISMTYAIYCHNNFKETKYCKVYDRSLTKDISKFASQNFVTTATFVINTQGINILVNIFFNVGVNAARAIATQIQGAITQFVGNFSIAITPQIVKLYASGDLKEMHSLIVKGAKFSCYLFMFLAVPIFLEADNILELWLTDVPPDTVVFTRLCILATLVDRLGFTSYTACMATGKIKKYVIYVSLVDAFVFPITYFFYLIGSGAEIAYVVLIFNYAIVDIIRLFIMKNLIQFSILYFVKDVVVPLVVTLSTAIILPTILIHILPQSFIRLLITSLLSVVTISTSVYFFGLTKSERIVVKGNIDKIIAQLKFFQ